MPHTSRFKRVLSLLMVHLLLGLPVARGESGPSSAAPEISHVVEGVDQGGTLVIFGENLNHAAQPSGADGRFRPWDRSLPAARMSNFPSVRRDHHLLQCSGAGQPTAVTADRTTDGGG